MSAAQRWSVRLVHLIAATIGLKYGYDFGVRLSGMWFGVALALNTGFFCSLIVGSLAERLIGGRRRTADDT